MKKRFIILAAVLMAALVAVLPSAAQADGSDASQSKAGSAITVHIDGALIQCDVPPIIENSRVFLPMRAAAEAMGASVVWDNAARDVQITTSGTTGPSTPVATSFILNNNSYKFHRPTCSAVDRMTNPIPYQGTRESLISQGYTSCKLCNP